MNALEAVNGSAIMLVHIPPAECLHPYGVRIQAIQERYQHIIRFSLSGHTHNEEFNVVKSVYDDKNVGVNFIAGSLTPYTDKNPAFTVIEIDAEYLVPVNFKTYFFNLSEADEAHPPQWTQLHDFIDFYGIPNVGPSGIYALAEKILNDEQTAIDFIWNKGRR